MSRAASVCRDDFQPGITWGEPARLTVDFCRNIFYLFHHPGVTFLDQRSLWLDFFHQLFSLSQLNIFGNGSSFFWPKQVNIARTILSHHRLSHCFILLGWSALKSTLRYSILPLNSPSTRRRSSTIPMTALFAWDWKHCAWVLYYPL